MPHVHVLDKELSELIAAGEVIERPSSVIKELVENSIDSGASSITVEIRNGGTSFLRITDNGCGMSFEDVPVAFMRHATSKINDKEDLANIMTLGFRGEALASVCAVSRCECITKQKKDELGTRYVIEGAEEKLHERTGCPDGTTIIVRNIFYNVPARLKFLRKDQYEGNAIASIIGKIAVSHPEISFRFIRDNRQEIFTPGDNRLYSAIYSVFGKEFAASMMPVSYTLGGISINGYTVRPVWGRKNRTMQHFFVNGRYVRSLTCMSSLEEAYKNCIMEHKFPACVIFMDIPPSIVDVNVHPAKIEVRFSDDKTIYDALYFAVKNAILAEERTHKLEVQVPEHKPTEADYKVSPFMNGGGVQQKFAASSVSKGTETVTPVSVIEKDTGAKRREIQQIRSTQTYEHPVRINDVPSDLIPGKAVRPDDSVIDAKAMDEAVSKIEKSWEVPPVAATEDEPKAEIPAEASIGTVSSVERPKTAVSLEDHIQNVTEEDSEDITRLEPQPEREYKFIDSSSFKAKPVVPNEKEPDKEVYFRLIGEAFKNFAIAETEDSIIIIDKHAAHERIRFERLRTGREDLTAQMLLDPVKLRLDFESYDAIVKSLRVCADLGFVIEQAEAPFVMIKGIPSMLDGNDPADLVTELAENFAKHRHDPLPDILDDIYHSMSCKGAIKAHDITGDEELKYLFREVLGDERIKYCPHGRPIMFELTKYDLEKQFKRIV
ncbi:MAG: DNA mismatch repair endonuclease MutL [Oscillospiraceae bacterium]|nr:DNA mismatch repair endonuclease MutL [Oscillospiraceae bacterium]